VGIRLSSLLIIIKHIIKILHDSLHDTIEIISPDQSGGILNGSVRIIPIRTHLAILYFPNRYIYRIQRRISTIQFLILFFWHLAFHPISHQAVIQGIEDINVVVQSYNYGGGYIGYVASNGKKHSFTLAENFARDKSGGKKVTYTNPIAVARNGGWRYAYGNMFYVELVSQYLTVSQVSGELAQKIMNEALKYQGWDYVYGGSNPNTSFDCSGLVQWCYGKAGISLPRTAQAQYDATQHIPLSQAQAGDLVFFHSTYNAGTYVTHVGIYVGNNQMYHAGDPIGYADLNNSYWQQHLIGAGRIKQ